MNKATPTPPLPDRLSTDPRSSHHIAAVFEQDIGIRFNDKERFDVAEYCTSEGWIRVPAGKAVDRKVADRKVVRKVAASLDKKAHSPTAQAGLPAKRQMAK